MFHTKNEPLMLTVPLTLEAHQIAQQFHQQHCPQKAKQVYLNTLAVYAVKTSLKCLGIPTNWQASDSWNPIMQTLANTADLLIKDIGKLECRPVLPNAASCHIPADVWSDRIGYVAVELNQALTQAKLLGFLPSVKTEEIPLTQLISLEHLLDQLNSARQPVQLSQWLHNIVDAGWQTLETLFDSSPTELTFNFRGYTQIANQLAEPSDLKITRGKRLTLGRRYDDEQVILVMNLTPTSVSELDISVEIYPTNGQTYLPKNLRLMILDDTGETVMQAEARSTKQIQLQFSGEPGECFKVRVALADISMTEMFII
ncbi:MAG: DUF1822 family protein [Coleofasciculus sp. C1-SOL-03]